MHRFSWPAAIAAALLCFAPACALDDEPSDTDTTAQAVAGSCTVRRPYGWSVGFVSCLENGFTSTITLAPGGDITFNSRPFLGKGIGSVTLVCHANGDGRWDEVDKSCQRVLQ